MGNALIKAFRGASYIFPYHPVRATSPSEETPLPPWEHLGKLEVVSADDGTQPFVGLANEIVQHSSGELVDVIINGEGLAATMKTVQRGQLLTVDSITNGVRPITPGERCYVVGVALESASAEQSPRLIRILVSPSRSGRGA